jgi:hypothetical protein
LAGTLVIVGSVLSLIVTSWVALAELFEGSVAVYVTPVVPTGKRLPAGTGPRVIVMGPAELSDAVAVPRVASLTKALQLVSAGPVEAVTFAGAVIVGTVVSHPMIVLESSVTAAVTESARPSIVAPAPRVTAWKAMMFPLNVVFAPSVAAPPTTQ